MVPVTLFMLWINGSFGSPSVLSHAELADNLNWYTLVHIWLLSVKCDRDSGSGQKLKTACKTKGFMREELSSV